MKHEKYYHYITLLLRLLIAVLFIVFSVFIPKWLMYFTDKKTQTEEELFFLSVVQYQADISDAYSELQAFADEEAMNGVRLLYGYGEGSALTDEMLIEVVNEELLEMVYYGVLMHVITFEASDILSWDSGVLYSDDMEHALNGLEIWEVALENDEYYIYMTLDAEYHNILSIGIVALQEENQLKDRVVQYTDGVYKYVDFSHANFANSIDKYYSDIYEDTAIVDLEILDVYYTENAALGLNTYQEAFGYDDTTLLLYYAADFQETNGRLCFGIWNVLRIGWVDGDESGTYAVTAAVGGEAVTDGR